MSKFSFFILCIYGSLNASTHSARRLESHARVKTESLTPAEEPNFLMMMGTGVGVSDKQMGWSLNWGGLKNLDLVEPLFIGVDFAAYYWGTDFSRSDKSLTALQINASLVYQFPIFSDWFHPYMGISLGPVFSTRNEKGLSLGVSGWLKPGLLVPIADKLSLGLEPKLGVLESSFVMVGQLSGVFTW